MSAYVTVDSLETIGDRRLYLSTTSMCAGYTAECLLSLGRYKTRSDPSSMSPWIDECKRFIDDFISTLEMKSEAPYAMQRIANFISAKEGGHVNESISNWKKTKQAIIGAEKGENIRNIDDVIVFLKRAVDEFSDARKIISDKINAVSPNSREHL